MIADPPTAIGPEQRLADLFVEKHGLEVPVPVEEVVQRFAEVRQFTSWTPVDAVLHGLNEDFPKPLLLVNDTKPIRRRSFTLAHELGHLLLPWHVGTIECETGGVDEVSSSSRFLAQEREADRFASRVLVPRRFINRYTDAPVPAMLHQLARANVSAEAGLWSLASALGPGFVFVIVQPNNTVGQWFASHGTLTRGILLKGQPFEPEPLSRAAEEHGREVHQGRNVSWFRLRARQELTEESSDWRPLLLEIFRDRRPGELPSGRLWKSFNGIASSANSRLRTADPGLLAVAILHRFTLDEEWSDVVDHPLFGPYAQRRARAFTGT